MFNIRTAIFGGAVALIMTGAAGSVFAQGTFSDKALKRLEGTWITEFGRTIEFGVRSQTPKFIDTISPQRTLVGGYRQGDGGADYVLDYPDGLRCYYNVNFIFSPDGYDKAVFGLRGSEPPGADKTCIAGTLNRIK